MIDDHEEWDELRKRTADELRRVADLLEDDELRMTESPRVSFEEFQDGPTDIEITFLDGKRGRERHIELW